MTRMEQLVDAVNCLSDEDAAQVAWVVIRQLADRGTDLASVIKAGLDTDRGGKAWQVAEAIAQLEDII